MRTRDSALKKSHKTGLTTDGLIYKGLRNKVTQQLRQAKAMFFLNIIKQAKGNSKQLWQTIDKLTGKMQTKSGIIELKIDDENHKDGLTVSNYFNNSFIDSVNEMIQHASGLPHPCSSPQPSIYDHEVLCFKHGLF